MPLERVKVGDEIAPRPAHGRPRVVGLVPARGGSKGIPGKNRRKLRNGLTLVQAQVQVALEAGVLEGVFVSTDDLEIVGDCVSRGLQYIERPSALAQDAVPMLDVIQHAAMGMVDVDAIMLLMPTYPWRSPEDVVRVFWEFARDPSRPLVGILPASTHPELAYWAAGERVIPVQEGAWQASGRRQDRRPAYELCLFACVLPVPLADGYSPNCVHPDTRAMVLDRESCLDIDTPTDLERAIAE